MRLPFRIVLIVVAAVAFFTLPALLDFLADWLWFGEVGYQPVYATQITAEALLGGGIFVTALAWLGLNIRHAITSMSAAPLTFTTREGITVALPTRDQLRPLVMAAVVIAAFLIASIGSAQWLTLLTWWHQVPFGKADAILHYDAAFYVFTVPVIELARGLAFGLVLLAAAGSAALYVAAGQISLTPFGLRAGPAARRHLSWLAAALFVVLALSAWLARLEELITPSGIIQGPSYADVYARMPAALVLAAAALAAAVLAAVSAITGSLRLLIGAAAVYFLVLFGGQGYATMLQRFAVTPNEQVRETPFMEYNIAATREAFALDRVEERELNGDATLTRADIEANRATLDNVRLWDHQPLLETFGQIQEIRTYYDFVSVDNDRYLINGQN
ncbi:MAG: UPF0182 family protein, partial [Vicinamibacterales bacterium]